MPCFCKRSPKALALLTPQSLFTTRNAAFLMWKLSTYFSNAVASMLLVGALLNIHGLPEVVILSEDEVSTTMGTWYSMSLGMTASVKVEPQAPISTGTLSRTMSFSATAEASVGLLLL